jgi:hypothetical protein
VTDFEYSVLNRGLLPCPFCGGAAEFRLSPHSRGRDVCRDIAVLCSGCGVIGPDFGPETDDQDQPLTSAVMLETARAIYHWNKRV